MNSSKHIRILFAAMSFVFVNLAGGCSVVRLLASADIDPVQLAQAREATMVEVRYKSALQLSQRLASKEPIENADIILYLAQDMLNKAAKQYESRTGWLNEVTRYTVKSIRIVLNNGSAIATLRLTARSERYSVSVDMMMDCIMSLNITNGELVATIEPFNIAPEVTAGGFLAGVEDIIRDIVKIKIATMSKDFPPLKFPVDFSNQAPIQGSVTPIRGTINLNIDNPRRLANYRLQLKETLIFEEKILVALNLDKVEVK